MGHHSKKPPQSEPTTTKDKLKQIKKERKSKLKEKRARLIIRNLPFHATEDDLREHFGKFGEISSIDILKKEDGQLTGCGFVQYNLVQKAAKAKHHTNAKPFLGRDILVDFALSKNKYEKTVEVKEEKVDDDNEIKIKEEPIDSDEEKEDTKEIEEEEEDAKDIAMEEEQEESDAEDVKEESDAENLEEESDAEDLEEEEEEEIQQEEKKPRIESNDINEGRTIFIKNVPFSATNEDLKECMRQFGHLFYALICIDKFTEHSKGTAFVKFQQKEDAEKALSAGTELTLLGNVLDCHKALSRNDMNRRVEDKKEEKATPRDSRNLYLVKEGVILAGTKAAEGVSATDMAKRLQLEQYKTQMLRNLNMYVARDRLVIHNVPPKWDDAKLRALFLKYSPKGTVIRETRIMRDLKTVDTDGRGVSKEFAFVAFTRHSDALAALRTLNNNPQIFSATKRPILAFSIENKSMVRAKLKRLEKSKLNNPKCSDFDPKVKKQDEEKRKMREENQGEMKNFAGVTAKPGVQKMRTRFKLKNQAKIHHEHLKQEKKKQKFAKKSLDERKQEFIKQPKQKMNQTKGNRDNFSQLVTDYKKKLTAGNVNKTKWYEG